MSPAHAMTCAPTQPTIKRMNRNRWNQDIYYLATLAIKQEGPLTVQVNKGLPTKGRDSAKECLTKEIKKILCGMHRGPIVRRGSSANNGDSGRGDCV